MTKDGKGFLYVLDRESNEVIKYDENLKLIKKIGKKGWNNGEFDSPDYIDGSSGLDIYVADGKNFRIQRFDLNLSYVSSLITNSEIFPEEFKFSKPKASIIINSNDLYVVDGDNPRVVIFNNGTSPTKYFGGYQTGQYALLEPRKMVKDSYNNLYIFDFQKKTILKFDNFGNYIKEIKLENIISISEYNGILYILAKDGIYFYDTNKNGYTDKKNLDISVNTVSITDFLVINDNKYFILEKNKLSYWTF
jgi:hypothetical protein